MAIGNRFRDARRCEGLSVKDWERREEGICFAVCNRLGEESRYMWLFVPDLEKRADMCGCW